MACPYNEKVWKNRKARSFRAHVTCGPPTEMKVPVILSEAKDLQFRSVAN